MAASGLSTAQQALLDEHYAGFKDTGLSAVIATKTDVDTVETMVTALGGGGSTGFDAETAGAGGKLELFEATANGTNKVTMAAPASLGADRTITVPDADVDLTSLAPVVALVDELAIEETTSALQAYRTAKALYDFGTDGGAQGVIAIGPSIPDNAEIVRTRYKVLTTLQSATDAAVVGLGFPSDDVAGLVAGIAISDVSNPWDAGWHEGIQDGAVANYSAQLTAARQITLEIATEDLTAGRLMVFCDYVVTE